MVHKLAWTSKHTLNAVCPYFTMFPLEFPFRILKRAHKKASIALDPFCGRGTTNYAARYLGIASFGIDSSPVAVAIAQAKLVQPNREQVVDLANELLDSKPVAVPTGSFWKKAYHADTLQQICQLRSGLLGRTSEAAILLRAIVLGCLHGPRAKDVDLSGYFSNQMPRTFASKPDYSVRFWKTHSLLPPDINVMNPIRRRLDRVLLDACVAEQAVGSIRAGDSTCLGSFSHVPRGITHVVTSPPYYGLVTYVEDQWIRSWFLGGESTIQYRDNVQLSHKSPHEFAASLSKVWKHCGDHLSADGLMAIRFGSIGSRNKDPRAILRQSLELSGHKWRVTHVHDVGTAHAGRRQADSMGTESAPRQEYDFTIRPQ